MRSHFNTEKIFHDLDRYISSSRMSFEELLSMMVGIPTVSADPACRRNIDRAADFAVDIIKNFGGHGDRYDTDGNPVVVGSFQISEKAPWITIYNHLDVQPAGEEGWETDPFNFYKKGDVYYGRGCTDDKGPALTALFAARFAFEKRIPVNIRLLWECEEEIGSPSFEDFLETHRGMLRSDCIIISDTVWISRKRPAISYFLRGLLAVSMRLETAERESHSGLTGGAARNPLAELCDVISKLHDAHSGRVKIPGFYKDVRRVSEREMRDFISSGFSLREFMRVHGLRSLRSRERRETLLRIWGSPTFEVHVINSSYPGPALKTVVPSWAEAKISMRLVPDQDPHSIFRILKGHVKRLNPDIKLRGLAFLHPFSGERSGVYADAVARAIKYGFGKRPVFVREGGSIGAVLSLKRYLKAPVIFMGLSLPEHNYHGPNENFDWGQASGGIKSFVYLFSELSKVF